MLLRLFLKLMLLLSSGFQMLKSEAACHGFKRFHPVSPVQPSHSGNQVNRISGKFAPYNDPKWNLIHSVSYKRWTLISHLQSHSGFSGLSRSANTPDGKEVEWAGAGEVSFVGHSPQITICQVTDSLIGNYKPHKFPKIKETLNYSC